MNTINEPTNRLKFAKINVGIPRPTLKQLENMEKPPQITNLVQPIEQFNTDPSTTALNPELSIDEVKQTHSININMLTQQQPSIC